ncbi:hypothetical protein NC651_017290 [Populus alba x Populus x berolinensis]|nr:hypothetical protein NC651_017290 [Populus alba x Populus x berolinensis]
MFHLLARTMCLTQFSAGTLPFYLLILYFFL